MCAQNGLQCCTEEYIEEVLNRTQELLPDGVRAELNRTIEIYARIIRRLQNCKTPVHAQVAVSIIGIGTGPADPVLAGPLFR